LDDEFQKVFIGFPYILLCLSCFTVSVFAHHWQTQHLLIRWPRCQINYASCNHVQCG